MDPAADKPRVLFTKTMRIDGFHCAHKEQTGHVSKIQDDGSLLLVLACGHLLSVTQEEADQYLEIDQEALKALVGRTDPPRNEESKMAKQSSNKKGKISNVNGVIPVQGYSDQVKEFKFNNELYTRVGKNVSEAKKLFRKLAAEVASQAVGDVATIEFLSDDGSATIPVSLPDIDKDANRTKLTDKTYKEAIKLGFEIDDLGITKTEESVTLTGSWAQWFTKMIDAKYREKGEEVFNGHEIKETTKTTLSVEGVKKLQTMVREGATEQERKLAEMLLDSCIKDATVNVR